MSNDLQAIRLQNYKAFKDTGWIEMANLTLLLGYNSNGKSTILKALEMIQKCYQQLQIGQELPVLTTNDKEDGSFEDMIYKGSKENTIIFSFRFRVQDEDIKEGFEEFLDIEHDEKAEIIYQLFFTKCEKEIEVIKYSISLDNQNLYTCEKIDQCNYNVTSDFAEILPAMYEVCNSFFLRRLNEDIYPSKLTKEEIMDKIAPANRFVYHFFDNIVLGCLNTALRNFASDLEYILPLRAVPSRQMLIQLDKSRKVGTSGEHVYRILYQAYFSADVELKEKVNKWLQLFGYTYEWNELKPNYGEFLLVDMKTGHKINIVDVGFGISQILPIIVAACEDGKGYLLLDSPEAHLHSRVQSSLGDLLIDAARKRKVVVETHSENIMLRVQKRIVENNDIDKEFARIYFIHEANGETVCEPIQFNEYGDFIDCSLEFTQFFSDGFKDVMDITTLKAMKYQEEKNGHSN